MSLIQVLPTDNFETWRTKSNLLSSYVGDFSLLNAEYIEGISPSADLVSVLNYISNTITRKVLVRSIILN